MSTFNVQKALENAQQAAILKKKLEEERQLIASLDLDSSLDGADSLGSSFDLMNTSLPKDAATTFGDDKKPMKSAKSLLGKEEYKQLCRDKITISAKYERLKLIGSTPEHHVITCATDLKKFRENCSAKLNFADFALIHAKGAEMRDFWQHGKNNLVTTSPKCIGPSVDVCLAWLSSAAQCPLASLLPPGEVFPNAEKYGQTRLVHGYLPVMEKELRPSEAVRQLDNLLPLLCVCDLSAWAASDAAIFLFCLCRIGLDALTTPWLDAEIVSAFQHVVNSHKGNVRQLTVEFAQLFPLIEDDICGLRLVIEILRLASLPPSFCLALVSELFIHLSERAECQPDNALELSEEDFIDAHLEAILETFANMLELYEKERSKQFAVLFLLDAVLHEKIMTSSYEKRMNLVNGVLQPWERQLNRSGSTDDVILVDQLRSSMGRLESYKVLTKEFV